jgi:hypothetical protein
MTKENPLTQKVDVDTDSTLNKYLKKSIAQGFSDMDSHNWDSIETEV